MIKKQEKLLKRQDGSLKMKANLMIIVFAVVAAAGNALLSYGQKKAAPLQNLYSFFAVAALVFCFCNIIAAFINKGISGQETLSIDKKVLLWGTVCGVALFILYFAINNLLVRYGASMYVVYSVFSVFFTSIIVGVLILKEKINIYHVIGIVISCVAVAFITIGNNIKAGALNG